MTRNRQKLIWLLVGTLLAILPQQTRAQSAISQYWTARAVLNRAQIQLDRQYFQSSEYTNAVAEVQQSRAALESARRPVLWAVSQSRPYVLLSRSLEKGEAELDALRANEKPDPTAIYAKAVELLAIRRSISQLQVDAYAKSDDSIHDLKLALLTATDKLTLLNVKHNTDLAQAESVRVAMRQLASANQVMLQDATARERRSAEAAESYQQRLASVLPTLP